MRVSDSCLTLLSQASQIQIQCQTPLSPPPLLHPVLVWPQTQSFGLTPSGTQQDIEDITRQLTPLLQNPWNWDVAQPLTRIAHGIHVSCCC